MSHYDAVLLLSFGGPERREDVMPFLEHVLRGKNVPHERLLEVAEHYYHFDGVSPINEQNRALIRALEIELDRHGPRLPIYWGNRNWHPFLADTLRRMIDDGVQRALAFVTSAYSSYSGCRQYLEDIERARTEAGGGAPAIDKIRTFFNHPLLIEALAEHVQQALAQIPVERHASTQLVYTAHSIPDAMARGCDYVAQLTATYQLVNERVESRGAALVYQSRSGPPAQPWLGPDICDHLRDLGADRDVTDVVIIPIGFMSDHMEVLYDLDYEAQHLCDSLGLNVVRAATPGTHPKFITMVRELIEERISLSEPRFLGDLGPRPHACPADCCPSGRPAARPGAAGR